MKEHQTGKCSVVVALRERQGRTLPFVTMSEAEGVALANDNISRVATISADEASHRDLLHNGWQVDRVNHSEIYSDHGKHTNLVESYFSRLRRMVGGSTTMLAHSTFTSMQIMPHGWKIIDALIMVPWQQL